jgi:hypothetical protein
MAETENEDLTRSDRWLDAGAYRKNWAARSALMLELYDEVTPPVATDRPLRVAEFGCGAMAPVRALCQKRGNTIVDRYDLRAWDDGVRQVDLNAGFQVPGEYDLITLSGVAEYLNDFKAVCAKLIAASQVLAVSYAFMPVETRQSDQEYLKTLRRRIVRHGWRSHHYLDEVMATLSTLGVVANTGIWNGQALFILRRFEAATGSAES